MTKQCFLIEDDQDDQEIFCMAIQEVDKSINCVVANDGVEALQMLTADNSFKPDYIFIDLNMPKLNGMDCLREIKKLEHLKEAKMIIYSTSAQDNLLNMSKQLGAADFIIKPPSLSLLAEKLATVFNKKQP